MHPPSAFAAVVLVVAVLAPGLLAGCGSDEIALAAQRRTADGEEVVNEITVHPKRVGIVVVDVWNVHWDPVAADRVGALVAVLNPALDDARDHGMTVFMAFADVPADRIRPGEPRAAVEVEGLAIAEAFPGNGFWWPEPPPTPYFGADPAQHQVPPDVDRAAPFGERAWDNAHPALRIDPDDVLIDFEDWTSDEGEEGWLHPSTLQLIREAQSREITHLVFVGVHTNWSVLHKNLGMTNMKRAGFTVLLARDLGDAFTGNGFDWEAGREDPALTPDSGNRLVNEFLERWFDGSVASWQWAGSAATRYAGVVGSTPGVAAHWRLEGVGDRIDAYLDALRLEAAWQEPAHARVCPGVFGTAACFAGNGAIVIGPQLRETLPPGSPLASVASASASIEVWVRPEGDGVILAHRDAQHVDFELALDEGHLELSGRDGGFAIRSDEPLAGGEWHHVVAVFDVGANLVRLYVDGDVVAEGALGGGAVAVDASWTLGSSGPVEVANGEPGEAADGQIVSSGGRGLVGAVDELAVYLVALDEGTIREHAEKGGVR